MEAEIDKDEEILKAAQALLDQLKPEEVALVTITSGQGAKSPLSTCEYRLHICLDFD